MNARNVTPLRAEPPPKGEHPFIVRHKWTAAFVGTLALGGALVTGVSGFASKGDVAELATRQVVTEGKVANLEQQYAWQNDATFKIALQVGAEVRPPPTPAPSSHPEPMTTSTGRP